MTVHAITTVNLERYSAVVIAHNQELLLKTSTVSVVITVQYISVHAVTTMLLKMYVTKSLFTVNFEGYRTVTTVYDPESCYCEPRRL